MDKARVITLFIGVVHAGSFSQAAVDAGLSAQAVSKAIRQLEEYLGVRLFHRTTRSLSLTDEGQRLFDWPILACACSTRHWIMYRTAARRSMA